MSPARYVAPMWILWLACGTPPPTLPDDGTTQPRPPAPTTTSPTPTVPTVPTVATPSISQETVPTNPCLPGLWPPVVLNEVVPGNVTGARDLQGSVVDTIEVALDVGAGPVDLAGWALSEGGAADVLDGWVLASDAPKVAFASGKRGSPLGAPPGEMHTSFRLDSRSGSVWLIAPDGCLADAISWTNVPPDDAIGRIDPTTWAFFIEPTPNAANSTSNFPGYAPPPTLPPAGYVGADPIEVIVPAGATARFTLDGSLPNESSPLVEGPKSAANSPTVLRVRTFVDGLWPSEPVSATYLPDLGPFDPGLRVVSLIVDPVDFFDDERGIWVYGDPADYEPWYPYFGANFWEDWERQLHVDLFEADGSLLLSQDAGIAIHGGYSRAFDQRGLRLLARSAYLDEDFDVAPFPREPITSATSLVLHNGGDWCSTHLFDATSAEWLRDLDDVKLPQFDSQAWEPVQVFLNGTYWGLYQMRERLNADFVATHHPVEADEIDQLELGWTHEPNWQVEAGDGVAFDALNDLVASSDLSDPADWAAFDAAVDTDNLAALLVAATWYGNSDFGTNNLRLWRPRTADGAFRWMLYDIGHGWPWLYTDTLTNVSITTWTGMPSGAAFDQPDFVADFALTAAELMATSFEPTSALAKLNAMGARVEPAMPGQLDRWCPGGTMAGWDAAMDGARTYAGGRTPAYREQVRAALGLAYDVTVTVDVEPAGAGHIGLSTQDVAAPFVGRFYAAIPLHLEAKAESGWVFTGWEGDIVTLDALITPAPGADLSVTAVFVPE